MVGSIDGLRGPFEVWGCDIQFIHVKFNNKKTKWFMIAQQTDGWTDRPADIHS